MALDYGWGCRFGQDKWHVIKIDEEENNDKVGVTVCGDGVLSRDSGDYIDYGGHPRIGTRCEKCEESRIDGWLDWLDSDCKDKESENETQVVEAAEVAAISVEPGQAIKEIQTRKKMFYFIATRRNKDIDRYFNSHKQLIDAKFKCVLTGDNVALFSFRCPKLGPQEEIVPIGYFCIITIREDNSICVGTTPQIPDELVDLIRIGGECADTAFALRP